MNLQPEVKKELLRIAGGTAICTAAMWVLFAALHVAGLAPFDYTVILGGIVGSAVAVGNFYGICVMVQRVLDEPDEGRRKVQLKLSYNVRMLVQGLWVVIAIAAPCFQALAGAAPLLFPRVTIYYLQITGKYKPAAPHTEEVSVEEEPPAAAGAGEPAAPAGAPRDEGGENEAWN